MTPDELIAWCEGSGGAEMANAQPFIERLCDVLGVPRPDATRPNEAANDYVFERAVEHTERGMTTSNRIDCYRRGCFVLEAKQGSDVAGRKGAHPGQGDLLPEAAAKVRAGTARRGTPAWDRAMRAAYGQAKGYVGDLPPDHPAPPFLIVVDVGHVIECYADFSGTGRNYTQFPGRGSHQVALADLRDDAVRERLRAVWLDPASLNPAIRSAEVTRDIATRLATVARRLEGRERADGTRTGHEPGEVATFLMRCLFTMFAEDVELIARDSFTTLLGELVERPRDFVPALEDVWAKMDAGGYARGFGRLKRFNGSLFKDCRALPLDRDGIHELHVAARQDWSHVEPAIFGTLLERALNPRERSSLGAHYTPRAYVERLVVPTVIEPLREDWEEAQGEMERLGRAGDAEGALAEARAFHHRLCTTRVLDPACGTGNFLYVALELMKRLEGEVLEAVRALGGDDKLALAGETVEPSQFLGLELNPRAVPIAELVLWIGYLKGQLTSGGPASVGEPVLRATGNIRHADAVLAWDAREPRLDDRGEPVTVWDGFTTRPHPATGLPVPDERVRVPAYRYTNPRRAEWPEAEFIVGNPPFIGGKDMRAELGDGYAEAVWRARPAVPGGADFVMQWWDEAAERLARRGTAKAPNPLRRFGFITTNSLTQTFSRRVVERALGGKATGGSVPVSLAFAVADHPWVKGAGRAAVRIAMTVARRGSREGTLGTVRAERDLDTDAPVVPLDEREGTITAKLTLGANLSLAQPLLANEGLSSRGVSLHGSGFIVTPERARALGLGRVPGLERHILDYRNGRDLAGRSRGVKVIDLYGLDADEVRERFPEVYQHVAETVKPHRDENARASYRDNWWTFGEPRTDLRAFTADLPRFIVTIETTKHRVFRFLDASVRPDNMLVAIGLDRADVLAVLSSRWHAAWSIAAGGWMGVGNDPRYSKSRTFDPFPFPAILTDPEPDHAARASLDRLRELGEQLEAHRRERLDALPDLTMTGLYNMLERRREAFALGEVLGEEERAAHDRARVPILAELHDAIDAAVLAAYGWSDLADALVGRPGGTVPSAHKDAAQEAAEDALLARLVELNRERAAEEARGHVRWLRPDYQVPRLGAKVPEPADGQADLDVAVAAAPDGLAWPAAPREQFGAVRELLDGTDEPLPPEAVARAFKGRLTPKRRARVDEVLAIMADLGTIRTGKREGQTLYFTRR